MKIRILFVVLAVAMMLSACGGSSSQGALQVNDPWIRPANMSPAAGSGGMSGMSSSETTSAAYMIIRNTGSAADKLIKAQTDAAKTVEIHTTVKEGEVMKMQPVAGVDVPANGQAELKPGGFHVMLIGITRDLKAGDKVKLTLTFEKAGAVQLEVPVRAP